jgi:hypothetical protein
VGYAQLLEGGRRRVQRFAGHALAAAATADLSQGQPGPGRLERALSSGRLGDGAEGAERLIRVPAHSVKQCLAPVGGNRGLRPAGGGLAPQDRARRQDRREAACQPSWYMITTEDRMIPPAAQRTMSQRTGATTVEVAASHSVYLSQPRATADLIKQAARIAAAP